MPGKLTEQPVAGVGTEDDLYMVVQSVQNRKQTRTQLRTGILSAWQTFIRTFLASSTTSAARSAIGAQEALTFGTGTEAFLATPSSANLRAALTDETGTGVCVFGTAPTIAQPNLVGVTGASNAAAGSIGEYVSSTVLSGSAVALSSNIAANVTSISLTAGDWDVWGNVVTAPAGTTTTSTFAGAINTVSATFPTSPNDGASFFLNFASPAGAPNANTVGRKRLSLSSTTTVYLIVSAQFAVSTNAAYGFIGARRVR